jgi:hypothetical protein
MARIQKTMTPAAEAANRVNGAESGGPASDPGKERSKMNALKHGKFARRPDPAALLLAEASPEEEAEREALRAEVVERYQPPDAFAEQAAEELADLRFELRRLERVKQVLWQRERELLELERRRRAQTIEHRVQEVTDGISHHEVERRGLMQAPESPGKYRELLLALDWLKVQMDRRQFQLAWAALATIYGDSAPSWRGERLLYFVRNCQKAAAKASPEAKAEVELLLSQFHVMLTDELHWVKTKLELCELEQGPLSEAGQAMRLLEATSSRKWGWVRQQENFLRRSIDRRLRILIELRRDHAKAERQLSDLEPASGGGQPQPPGPLMGRPQPPGIAPGAQPDSGGGSPCPPEASDTVRPPDCGGVETPPFGGPGGGARTAKVCGKRREKTHRTRGTNPPSALESINAPAAKPLTAECRAGTRAPSFRRQVSAREEARTLPEIRPRHLYWNGRGTAGGHAAPNAASR